MGKRTVKLYWYLLGLSIGVLLLILIELSKLDTKLIVCDVGQGDAIIFMQGNTQMLVDGGPSLERMQRCLAQYMPFWDRTIELVVMTNSDYDHLNGLIGVVDTYKIDKFVTADGLHETKAWLYLRQLLLNKEMSVVGVEQGDKIDLGLRNIQLSVLWPDKLDSRIMGVYTDQLSNTEFERLLDESEKRGDLNERSVVLQLEVSGKKILLTGDIGIVTEQKLISQNLLADIDILKVAHHGSKNSTAREFLAETKPEIAIISAGQKNRYGHPAKEALDRLEMIGVAILRTDLSGDIVYENW